MAIRKEKIIGKEDKEKKYKPTEELEEDLASTFKIESQKRLQYAKDCFRAASESRRRYDWEWLARDLFRRGYQFSRYNPANRTVILASRQVTRIPVNLTAAAIRVIRNQVTAFRPKWEVLPAHAGEEAAQNARYSEKILDWIWRKERLKKKVKETVMQGLIFSVGGPWQIGWDDNIISDDGTKGNLYIWNMDPYDFYIDPNCTDGLTFSDAEYVIKAVRKPLDEVKRNPLYKNTEQITTGEARVAASEYKQFLLQSLKYLGQYQQEENETVILKEGWFKERDEDGNVRMRVITWVDQMTDPLRDELTEETEFPFVQYQADINPLEVYGESWARHVIVINRVVNALESSIFDYNYRYAKGRIVVDKNAGVRAITNEHGSIIEKNRGADVHSLPLQPLPPSVEGQVNRMRAYFEDISGAHDVSLGRIPAGVKSGIGVAELKQADATNQDDLVDNLEDFLVEVGKKVLKIVAQHFDTPRIIKITGVGGKTEYFSAIGEKWGKGRKREVTIGKEKYPLAVIAERNEIDVSIGSWLAASKESRQQLLRELYREGVIDKKTLLEHLEFGDIETIMERTRSEEILKAKRGAPGQTEPGVSEEELALSENEMMLEGRSDVQAQPQDDHQVHLAVHQEAIGKGQDDIVNNHIAQHKALLGGGTEVGAEGGAGIYG